MRCILLILFGFCAVSAEVSAAAVDRTLEKNLELILIGNKSKSQGIVERGAEGVMLRLISPSRVEQKELVNELWSRFDQWIDANGPQLSFETLVTIEQALEDVVDATEDDAAYTKTAWKPSLFYGMLTGGIIKATGAFWFRRLLRKINIKIRKEEHKDSKRCCRAWIFDLAKTGFSKVYRRYPGTTEWALLSAGASMGYYFFLYKDEEPGDREQHFAERQILPQIQKLKETATRQSEQ
jgi:hypothetical protein